MCQLGGASRSIYGGANAPDEAANKNLKSAGTRFELFRVRYSRVRSSALAGRTGTDRFSLRGVTKRRHQQTKGAAGFISLDIAGQHAVAYRDIVAGQGGIEPTGVGRAG